MPVPLEAVTATRIAPVSTSTTEAELTQEVLRVLQESSYTETHTNACLATTTSLTIATGGADRWRAGDVLEWRDNGDRAIVTSVADTTLTVRRGHDFTTATTHDANTVIAKRPRFWFGNVVKAVNDAVYQDLFPELYAVYSTEITAAPTSSVYYAVPDDAVEVLRVYQKTDSSTPQDLDFLRDDEIELVDASFSSTNRVIRLDHLADDDNTIFCQYTKRPAITDLSEGMAAIVVYGACRRLMSWEAAEQAAQRGAPGEDFMTPQVRSASWFATEQARMIATESALQSRPLPRRNMRWVAPRFHL